MFAWFEGSRQPSTWTVRVRSRPSTVLDVPSNPLAGAIACKEPLAMARSTRISVGMPSVAAPPRSSFDWVPNAVTTGRSNRIVPSSTSIVKPAGDSKNGFAPVDDQRIEAIG
jgi:hypothetical protein